jgi:ribulose-5-phosphate 4-epimerase/fuculose-1-phosphate aldolase
MIRELVTQACQILAFTGQGDALLGHVSHRVAGEETFWMKAAGCGLEEVSPGKVLHMHIDGSILDGHQRCHSEWPIHSEIYRVRTDINAIVHTHALHACVFSALAYPLHPLSYEGALFAPDNVVRFDSTADLIASVQQGREVASVLSSKSAMLLRNHGLVTVGPTIEEACMLAIHLEKACQMQLMILRTGLPYTALEAQEIQKKRAMYTQNHLAKALWAYYKRKVLGNSGTPGEEKGQ